MEVRSRHLTVLLFLITACATGSVSATAESGTFGNGTPAGNGYGRDEVASLAYSKPSGGTGGWFGPDNYWECILDDMPGVATDLVASAVREKCYRRFPSMDSPPKKQTSMFGIKNALDCVVEHGKNTASERGAKVIRAACYKLYSD